MFGLEEEKKIHDDVCLLFFFIFFCGQTSDSNLNKKSNTLIVLCFRCSHAYSGRLFPTPHKGTGSEAKYAIFFTKTMQNVVVYFKLYP